MPVPCRLGKINSETGYLLKRFHFEEPVLLKDARKTLAEIELDPAGCGIWRNHHLRDH